MKLSLKLISFLFVLSITFCGTLLNAQSINDLIQPVRLIAGEPDTLYISDLFSAGSYNLAFQLNKNIDVKYDRDKKLLVLTANKSFEGMDLLDFKLGSSTYELPFISEVLQSHLFEYKPEGTPKTVNLFGTFNGWNRSNLVMQKEGDFYKISVPMEPGRYEYRFYVDGEEILDPVNPEKAPNGAGSSNSVLYISPLHPEKSYLHILGKASVSGGTKLSFYFEGSSSSKPLDYSNLIPLINNTRIPESQISINGNEIDVTIKKEDIKRNAVVRLALTRQGQTTNVQVIDLSELFPDKKDISTPQDQIIYSIMIDRFYNGDKNNDKPIIAEGLMPQANYKGGDFQGIIDKLNSGYFDSLGINTLWLSPVVDNPNNAYREYPPPHRLYTGYHGYWPINSSKVEEHFGTMSLLKELISIAHKHHIKVILDYVAHHVYIQNSLYKQHQDWFGVLTLPDGRKNLRLWDEQRLTTWFEPYLPTFNYLDSKDAREAMTDNAVWWLKETNADGFRHDAVKHIPNSFWRLLSQKIRKEIEIPQHKTIYQIGETFGSYQLVSSYVNNGQLNAQFNFNLYDVSIPTFVRSNASFATLDKELQKSISIYGINNVMGNIMDSHDKVRFMAFADNAIPLDGGVDASELGWSNPPAVKNKSSYNKLKLYLCYLLTTPGVPVIDYGDEFGMTGAADPDNRRMMRFDGLLSPWEKETLQNVRQIINARDKNSALRHGDYYSLQADTSNYIYIRSDMNQRVLVALNKSDKSEILTINLPAVYKLNKALDLLNSSSQIIKDNSLEIEIPGMSYKILSLK
jgi:cyclomaltodextrinase / maltogenic alpha-amylase / neopullulanase